MILSELLGTFRDLANNHTQIEGFYTGLVEEHNDSLIQYPALRISFPYNALASQDDDVLSYTFDLTLLVNDLIEDVGNEVTGPSLYEVNTNFNSQQDELNEIDTDLVDENLLRERAVSIMAQYIQGVRNLEEEPQYFVVQDGWLIQSLERYGNDSATGCKVTLTISVANDYKCQSIANIDERIWRNSNVNQLTMPDFVCPDCPEFPTLCPELLAELSVSQLNDCILPTYDFSDTVVQNSLQPIQVNDLTDWLCPTVPVVQTSLLFDGTGEYINCRDESVIDFERTDAFSMSVWAKAPNASGTYFIFGKRRITGEQYYGMFFLGGAFTVILRGSTGAEIRVSANTPLVNNTWYHFAFSYDGSSDASGIKMYVDGVDTPFTVFSSTVAGTMLNTGVLSIGGSPAGLYFNGYTGYARIWNRVMLDSEMLLEYNSGTMLETLQSSVDCVFENKSGQNALFYGNWAFPDGSGNAVNTCPFSVLMEYTDVTIDVP